MPPNSTGLTALGYDFVAGNRARTRPEKPADFRTARNRLPNLAHARNQAGARKRKRALTRIKAAPGLSRDLADIVERALAAP